MTFSANSILFGLGWLTVVSTALVSHTYFTIPPALFVFSLVLLSMFVIALFFKKYCKIPIYSFIVIPFVLFVLFTQIFTSASVKNVVGPVLSAFYFTVTIYYLNYLNKKQIIRIVNSLLIISVVILFCETVYRYVFPNYEVVLAAGQREGEEGVFYMFKSKSLMYSDSNGAAIHMLIILFFTYYWGEIMCKKYIIIKCILIILIGFTISRAAWFGTFIGIVYFEYLRNRNILFWITFGFFLFVLMLIVAFVIILPFVQQDGSFLSKFMIAEKVVEYYQNTASLLDVLIGVGVYQSKSLLGIYAHSFLIVQVIEMGVVSLLLLIFMWVLFDKYSKGKSKIILLPFFLTTLSSTLSFMPVLYTTMAIICLIETQYRNENSLYRSFIGK